MFGILATGLAGAPAEVLSSRRVPPSATPMTGPEYLKHRDERQTVPAQRAFLTIGSCLYHHPTVDSG